MSVLSGVQEGQSVDVGIQRYADGRHSITDIERATEVPVVPEGESESPMEMDHSGHDMSGSQMPVEPEQDESTRPPEMDHSGHDMSGNNSTSNHDDKAAEARQ
jgi:hypothetical protein